MFSVRPFTRFVHFAAIMLLASIAVTASAQNFSDVTPSPQQVAWQDLEFGVIIHFGTNTFLNREWGDGTADPSVFNPTAVDPDQWLKAAKSAGAKYVVLVSKHHDGFALWPTGQTNYSVKNSPWLNGKGDLVRMTSDAARVEGMKFGVYLSPWDRHEPKYKDSTAYDAYYLSELDELAGSYGQLVEFWLDGAGSAGHVYNFPKYIENLRMVQPNTIVFADTALFDYGDARWVGNEGGFVPYENWNVIDRHGYLRWRPVEVDTPLHNQHWFWHPNDESSLKTVDQLMKIYEESVGRGGQLMLGLAPDTRGLLPDADVKRLQEFGAAVRARYSNNLALHHLPVDVNLQAALDNNPDTFWSAPLGSHHATLELHFAAPITFDRALTMEWLNAGQHVQKYSIDIWDGNAWKPIVTAEAIGHKKIDVFPAVTTSRVRLNILSSYKEAHIREFQLYNTAQK